jgi:NAD(P)-dependent dehydrogenase (short-subunit alcohol dehydrogenase family)
VTTPRLRVLFVTNRATWPAYPGFKARAGLLLECLARDHDVTAVVVLAERQDEPTIPPHVRLAASTTVEVPKPSKPRAVLRWATLGVPMPFATVQWERARRPVAEVLAGSAFDLVVAIDATTVRFLPDDLPAPLVIDFDDLQWESRRYDRVAAYGQSKLANLMFTYDLQRRLAAAAKTNGAKTIAVAAHPGVAATELVRHVPGASLPGVSWLSGRLLNTSELGALPTLRAATDPAVRGGQYYGPDGFKELRGYPVLVTSNVQSNDKAVQERLWSVSEKLTGVTYPV